MKLMKLASQSDKSLASSMNRSAMCFTTCCCQSALSMVHSDTSMAGYAIVANKVPKSSCSGNAITSGRHCTRRDAQYETIKMGSSSTCCITRASQGANSGTLVTCAMPVRMLYAYSTFESVTYSQNKPTIT